MLDKLRGTIKEYSIFTRGDTVAVAVSGGLDSTVLLHALYALRAELGIELAVCHLNHALRGEESKGDYAFVEALAQKLGLPFEGRELKVGELASSSTQAAARDARYAFFDAASGSLSASKVALAHTLDDHAETVLMRFVKGSGPGGLKGIAPVRGKFVRPLIGVTKAEVAAYAESNSIEYVEDSSNKSDKYLRNKLRGDLLPHIIKGYNPNMVETLARTAIISARDDEYLRGEADSSYADALTLAGMDGAADGSLSFDRVKLLKLHPAVSTRVFLKGAGVLGRGALQYASHVNRFIELVKSSRPNIAVTLPGGLTLLREYDSVTLSTEEPCLPVVFDMALDVPGTTGVDEAGVVVSATLMASPPDAGALAEDPMTAFFDYDAMGASVGIRSIAAGDKMVPMGMRGHKKLKDIFIDLKIPAQTRARTPLLYAGGSIIWAVGLVQSESFKVGGSTSRVLKIECRPS